MLLRDGDSLFSKLVQGTEPGTQAKLRDLAEMAERKAVDAELGMLGRVGRAQPAHEAETH